MSPQDTEIYLDNNATTRVDERVIEAMVTAMGEHYGNPASSHPFGERAAAAVAEARASVARMIGARTPAEIVFTSGGTESINTALHAAVAGNGQPRDWIITSAVEHPASAGPLERWRRRGMRVLEVGVDSAGRLDLPRLHAELAAKGSRCALVSLLWANNETGVLLTRDELSGVGLAAHEHGALFHVDAVQVPGKFAPALSELPLDLLSISAHKFHGPKGVGALWVHPHLDARFEPLLLGGPQESERRAGTPNVPGMVGMGVAARLAHEAVLAGVPATVGALRERLEDELMRRIPGTEVNGGTAARLVNTSNLRFRDLDGGLLQPSLAAAGLAVSSGSACGARTQAPSPVLLAMGLDAQSARASVRLSLSRMTTESEVEGAIELLVRTHAELAALRPAPGQK